MTDYQGKNQNMSDIELIIDRMRQVTNSKTDAQLAKYLELKSNSAISTWKARNRIPYPECHNISQRENVDLGWLITGKQSGASIFPNPLVGNVVSESSPEPIYAPSSYSSSSDVVAIPEYDQRLSAGMGTTPSDAEQPIQHRYFDKVILSELGVKAENIKLLRVMGDSNDPDLKDKDLVMVDVSKNQPNEVYFFAVRLEGELFVKSIQRDGSGNLLLVSKNKFYLPIKINHQNPPSDFEIIGMVVWNARSWI